MNRTFDQYNQLAPDVEARVEALLNQMTLAEKVGQLVQENIFSPVDWEDFLIQKKQADENGLPFVFSMELRPGFEEIIQAGKTGVINSNDVRVINRLQKISIEQSRMHIPLLVGHDVIHGFRTVFPIPLAESCTWNPDLIEQIEQVAATEASATGINWVFSPMIDISRDPRWGRIAEGAGEDPFLGMAMARARLRGLQSSTLPTGRRIIACPKHYVAYGAAEAGRDYNTVDISERTLREVYLPPFKAAFDTGAGSIMSAFNEISGIPGTCNPFTLRTVLRHEWAWPGVVISDYNAIGELVEHGVATDLKEAARLSILAGIDIDMESGAYAQYLPELVNDGTVSINIIDEAVRRVLRLKFAAGLFENPYTDDTLVDRFTLCDEFRSLALETARQSMVLLKNSADLLPINPQGVRIALIGPLANNRSDLLGAWAIGGQSSDVETVLMGIESYLPEEFVTYVQGCAVSDDSPEDFSKTIDAAQNADVVVLVLGESAVMSGEAHSRAYLGLPGRQQELVNVIAAIGKPIVCVLMCGRPLVIPYLAEQVDALLVAWHGGIRAGQAVADILFGGTNPSGKLTTSWPRAEGQIPVYYSHKNTGRPAAGSGTKQFDVPFRSTYLDELNAPLFPFGFGLSYTQYQYRNLIIETPCVSINGILSVSAIVQNTGEQVGTEIVQLYVRDMVATVTRPVKELKGFLRVELQPGEEKRVRFDVPVSEIGFYGLDTQYVVEPGIFTVWIGPDSTSGLEGQFEVRS